MDDGRHEKAWQGVKREGASRGRLGRHVSGSIRSDVRDL
jgi:hypothetical protein